MAASPKIIHTVPTLRRAIRDLQQRGRRVALVPTMGALHAGHLALVKLAQSKADKVVVSIFVNPTQFAPHEDFASYPRTLQRDVAALREIGVDLVWAPSPAVMYPDGFATRIAPEGPALAGLEDKYRPHFFGGVATVVTKLFTQCAPDIAVFGEKDYQQLQVVRRLVVDLDLPLKIIPGKTIREKDGLALSSRNAYLSDDERQRAPTLYRALTTCAAKIKAGQSIGPALKAGRKMIEAAGFELDYLEAREAESLAPVRRRNAQPLRLLVAARLGRTRLIDNISS